jgi:hypothetical protein
VLSLLRSARQKLLKCLAVLRVASNFHLKSCLAKVAEDKAIAKWGYESAKFRSSPSSVTDGLNRSSTISLVLEGELDADE